MDDEKPDYEKLVQLAGLAHFGWHRLQSRCYVSPKCWSLLGAQGDSRDFPGWQNRLVISHETLDWNGWAQIDQTSYGGSFVLTLKSTDSNCSALCLEANCEVSRWTSEGQAEAILATLVNVTQIQQPESDYALRTDEFEAMADGASVGLWYRDLVSGRGFWSKRMQEVTGITDAGEDPGLGVFGSYIHEDDQHAVSKALQDHLDHRSPYSLDFRVVGTDKETRWIHAEAQARWTADGKPHYVAGSLADITAEKRAQETAENALKFQELMFSAIDDLLFVKDEDFRIVQANDAFLRVYPKDKRDQVIGFTTLEAYDEAQRTEFLAEDQRALDEGFSEVEESIDFPDGRHRTLWTKKIRFHDGANRPYVLGLGRDITDLKETERALRSVNAALEEFAYRVSHDLRSPLQSSVQLLGHLGEAIEASDTTQATMLLNMVQKSLRSLDGLAKDILDLHRVRRSEMPGEAVDIKEIVQQSWLRHGLHEKSVELNVQYELSCQPIVNPYAIKLVLDNLLSNAVKYRNVDALNSHIELHVVSDAKQLRVAVADNGVGIPEASRKHLFGMFKRFHPKQSFGSGLGLYMVQQWVERMHGTVTVDHLEPGTRFTISVAQQPSPEPSPDSNSGAI